MKEASGPKGPEENSSHEDVEGLEGLRMYNAKEVGMILRVDERSITGWADKGEIGHYRLGKRKVFSQEDIEKYLRKKHRPAKDGEEPDQRQVARVSSRVGKASKAGKGAG